MVAARFRGGWRLGFATFLPASHYAMTSRTLALNSGTRAGPPFPFFLFPKEAMERREAPPSGSPPGPEPTGVRGAPRQVPCYQGLPLSGARAQ